MGELLRQQEVRRSSSLFICRGTAEDFIENNKSKVETSPARQYQFIDRLSHYTSLFPSSDLYNFSDAQKTLYSSPVITLVCVSKVSNLLLKAKVRPAPLMVAS